MLKLSVVYLKKTVHAVLRSCSPIYSLFTT